jgi:hypothetical protein
VHRNEQNKLIFFGETGNDVLPATATLHNLINKLGYQDIVLDFSGSTFLNPSFMLPFATMARAFRQQKVDFDIILPTDVKAAKLLVNANWANLITPEKFDPRNEQNQNHLSATQYFDDTQHCKA